MKKPNIKFMILALGIITVLLAAGCSGSGTPPTSNPTPSAGLTGIEWTLVEMMGAEPLTGSTITLKLDGESISGRAGCNSFGGQYLLQGSGLTIGDAVATEMFCETPAGIMQQERNFFQALSQTASFALQGERLELRNTAGETILVFEQ